VPLSLLLVLSTAVATQVVAATQKDEFHWPKHGEGDIILDTNIRDWVLFPIFAIMICFTILREYANRVWTASSKSDLKVFKETQALKKSALLRTQGHWLEEKSFARRRAFFNDKDKGVFNDKEVTPTQQDPMAMMQDPNMMMMQQKSMFTVMLPQMVMMGLISYFFSGFVMVKIPLPLSLKFKAMTQRGIDLASLDTSFVSSLSWYFLVSYGISGVIQLILGAKTSVSDAQAMEQQMKMQTGQGPQQMDTPKLYQAESEALSMVEHKFLVEEAETRLLAAHYK